MIDMIKDFPYIPAYLTLEQRVDRRLKYAEQIEAYRAKHILTRALTIVECPSCLHRMNIA